MSSVKTRTISSDWSSAASVIESNVCWGSSTTYSYDSITLEYFENMLRFDLIRGVCFLGRGQEREIGGIGRDEALDQGSVKPATILCHVGEGIFGINTEKQRQVARLKI